MPAPKISDEMQEKIIESFKDKDMDEKRSVFEILSSINVSDKIEKKNGLSYLSWAWAWSEVKKIYPNANYIIYERDTNYGKVNYFTDGRTCWVKTGVIIEGLEHIEELPVMDYRNRSIPLDKVTSFDVNKTIQRSLTKALARHGLGLYIYAGEDLPEEETEQSVNDKPKQTKQNNQQLKKYDYNKEIEIRVKKLNELGTDINSQGSINFIDKYNHGKHDITKMNENELFNFICVLDEMIKIKEVRK